MDGAKRRLVDTLVVPVVAAGLAVFYGVGIVFMLIPVVIVLHPAVQKSPIPRRKP